MTTSFATARFRVLCRLHGVLPAAALLVLAGCATAPRAPEVPVGAGATPDPATFTTWTARGRIALAAQGEGGSGSFSWRQDAGRTALAVRGPLGAGGFDVATDGESLQLNDAAGRALDGEQARRELEARLGAPLPLHDLRYWLIGVPSPAHGEGLVQGASGATPGFVQGAWVVSYDAFTQAGAWRLPSRMTATTAGVKVRIVVDDWQVPTP